MKSLIGTTTALTMFVSVGCAQVQPTQCLVAKHHFVTCETPEPISPSVAFEPLVNESDAAPPLVETVAFILDGSSADADHHVEDASGTAASTLPAPSNETPHQGSGFPSFETHLVDDSEFGDAGVHDSVAYTLVDVEQIAAMNNPAIAAATAAACKAIGLRQQVGTRPNPSIGYFGQQIADRNTDQHGLFIEQEFVRGNKLQLNREVLGHTSRAQQMEIEAQRYRVLTDIRMHFFDAIVAQQQLEATRQFAKVARRGVEVAEQRQEAEEGTLIDTLQAKTLLSEITLAAEQSEAAFRGAWRDLAAVAGLPDMAPGRLVGQWDEPGETPDWEITYAEILAQSPELAVANALICEKQALLKRQKVQAIPNITAQLGAGYDDATDHGLINLQLSAPIPVFNDNAGNIAAAQAEYRQAIQNRDRIRQSIRSRLARVARDFDSSMSAVQAYGQQIIPQTEKSLDLSEQAYRAGELEFLQVLVVRRSYYESTIRYIQAKGDLAQATARVDGLLLSGGLDAPQDYTDGDGIRGQSMGGQ